MRISNRKRQARKSPQNWIWEGLGLHLGGVWDGLGRLWGALGRLLAHFWTIKIDLFSSLGPRWSGKSLFPPSETILARFWRVWEGFGRVLGGFWSIFGWILERFGTESGRELKNLKRAAIESLNGTPALTRSTSQCVGVSTPRRDGRKKIWRNILMS